MMNLHASHTRTLGGFLEELEFFFFFPPFEQCWKRKEGRSRDGRSSVGSGKEMKNEKQLPGAFIAGIEGGR